LPDPSEQINKELGSGAVVGFDVVGTIGTVGLLVGTEVITGAFVGSVGLLVGAEVITGTFVGAGTVVGRGAIYLH